MQTLNKEQLTPCHRMPVLRRDDRQKTASESVKLLQERLQKFGFSSLKADGFFGKKTEDVVKEFQERGNDHDPTVLVDGIVGPVTWQALGMCIIISDR
ncbi:peptidoglycan-binding domain-containing protein [Calothrix sp. UHCC 0171]|uniref:peptidoglycan-binding domain-containing protein n=1 Tax=Calothrix sp. UHCC 0171 TaxID=3110245 RepID=UPI002B206149|nr:peptidoglycan-binding domain-containing protein [Calothrix sp. UHCC 0171]MEA5573302.1 peptidoglycan-binding domain-containing protein [Calothrix sp. UHCC 0171]